MTTSLRDAPHREKAEWTEAWASDPIPEPKRTLTTTWRTDDPVEYALMQLVYVGRDGDAELIRCVLDGREDRIADHLARGLVSSLWAEDWDSEDDASYDEM